MRSARLLATGLLITPLLAGCFAAGAPGPDATGEGARLRVALPFPPTQGLSPYGNDGFILSRLGIAETLTKLDPGGAAVASLAESWSPEQDGREWLFTLRAARFQDGSELTPAAVATALNHAAQAKPTPTALVGIALRAEPVGQRQVRISTGKPEAVLPQRLSNPNLAVLAPKAYQKPGAVDPVGTGTGPFTLTRIDGVSGAALERFDGYWGGRARAAGVEVRFVADGTARANALQSGDVDLAEAIPVSRIAALSPGTVHETATARIAALFLNTRSGPFADPAVRAAARAAIDTSVLPKDVFEGHADRTAGLFGPPFAWAEGKRIAPSGRAEAAPVNGVAITLATLDNRPELPEIAQVLQQQLQRAGFTVRLEVRESARIYGDALKGKFDAFITSRNMALDTGDPVSVLASDFTCAGSNNLALLCDPAVDAAVAKAEPVADPAGRQDAVMAAEAAILRTDAVIPLVRQRAVVGAAASVRGAVFDPCERVLLSAGTHR